jgi:hypothetical protein
MSTHHRDGQICIRVSRALRSELEAAAQDDGRGIADEIRRVLVDYAAKRITDRASASTEAA